MHLCLKTKDQKFFSKADPELHNLLFTSQKKKERKKMKIQQHNKQTKSNRQNTPQKENQQDKTQKREGERMQLSDLRSMMHCLTKRQITTLPKLSVTDREHTRKQSEEPLLVSASAELNKSFR